MNILNEKMSEAKFKKKKKNEKEIENEIIAQMSKVRSNKEENYRSLCTTKETNFNVLKTFTPFGISSRKKKTFSERKTEKKRLFCVLKHEN